MADQQEEGSQERRRKVSVPKVRTILIQIGEELSKDELTKLIFLAKDHIPKSQTKGMDSLGFFSALEERQLIDTKQDDVDYLLELLRHLPRVDLMKKLNSSHSGSNYTESIKIQESTNEVVCSDAVMVTNTVEITANSWSVKQREENHEGFLQDPDLVHSMFQKYHDAVSDLEGAMKEKYEAQAMNVELKKKIAELKLELESVRDDQNNLIQERNSALGAKSEYVFRESELKKELSDLKRGKNILEKTCARFTNEIEAKDKEIADLKMALKENLDKVNDLEFQLEGIKQAKIAVEEELAKFQKDELEHGRVKCKRCGLIYVEANNPVDACRYHSGQFGCVGSIKKRFEWSCCKNANKNAPGCCKKKHLTINFPHSPMADESGRKFTM